MSASLLALLLVGCGKQQQATREVPVDGTSVEVLFSPKGGCTDKIVNELAKAKATIFCQAYSFTSKAIFYALVDAKKRGVDVYVILDRSQMNGNGSKLHDLRNAGIRTWVDKKHAIAHNKIMVIDEAVVLTGSFNFTEAAEMHNAENLIVIRNRNIASVYMKNWNDHMAHSEKAK